MNNIVIFHKHVKSPEADRDFQVARAQTQGPLGSRAAGEKAAAAGAWRLNGV